MLKKLGEGGMGEVYLAEHTTLGNRAAVKLLRPEMSAIPDIVQRFFNEARATSLIGHPGIVQVFDFGRHEASKGAYFIMELLAGEALSARLERESKLPAKLVIDLALLITDALGAAHAVGIVHRDLKPDNIFLVPDRASACGIRVKVLDFGIAKLATDAAGVRTSANALMGTPAYMSPEQCRGAGGVDHRSDIYSLGCILYEMATGQRPFSNAVSTGDLVVAHMHHPPAEPRSLEPSIPVGLERVILCTLAKRPSDRYQDMQALTEDLERVARGEDPSASPQSTRDPSLPRVAPGGTLPARDRGDTNATPSAGPTTLGGAASQSIARSRAPRTRLLWLAAALLAGGIATIAVVRLTDSPNHAAVPPAANGPSAPPATTAEPVSPKVLPATTTPPLEAPSVPAASPPDAGAVVAAPLPPVDTSRPTPHRRTRRDSHPTPAPTAPDAVDRKDDDRIKLPR